MLWAFLALTVLQLQCTVKAAIFLHDEDSSDFTAEMCSDIADGEYPCSTVRVTWVLVVFTAVMQFGLCFFLSDLVCMHTRFILMQKRENCRADQGHFFPTFISTYKMLG